MIESFLQLIFLFVFAAFILLPVYVNLFKERLFQEWQEKLEKQEQLKVLTNNRKKGNNVKK